MRDRDQTCVAEFTKISEGMEDSQFDEADWEVSVDSFGIEGPPNRAAEQRFDPNDARYIVSPITVVSSALATGRWS